MSYINGFAARFFACILRRVLFRIHTLYGLLLGVNLMLMVSNDSMNCIVSN